MKPLVYVFGEIHNEGSSVKNITEEIRKINPDMILHELLYEDKASTKPIIRERLRTCKHGGLCDPRINKDIYELGLELDSKLVGIDKEVSNQSPKHIQFQNRERHMLKVIKKYVEADYEKRTTIVIVVGDTHLREKKSKELSSPSILPEYFKGKDNIKVERAPVAMQELP